ncbi:MAK10-like protein [Tanacetum coccineum]
MGDANPICTLGDYSKPNHEGYMNTNELYVGNNVVPLRSDTIRLVQNGYLFYGLRSEDPNQHLKDFLKLMDSLDLDRENRERTCLHLFQFSLRDQASNWLERLPAGSITTWEDVTTRFLAQFFPPRRTEKLHNDILMFQHQGESLSEAWTRFKELLQKVLHHGIDLWLLDLTLYDNESWNDPRDFTKPVKAISLPQDVPSTSDRRLIELENQVQRLMEAHLAPMQPTQVNKNHYLIYQMKLEKALIDFDSHQEKRLSSLRTQLKQQQDNMISKINILWKVVSEKLDDAPIRDTTGSPAAQMTFTSTNDPTSTTEYEDHEMTVESEEEFEEETEDEIKGEEEDSLKHFDTFPAIKELRYHEWLLKNP